MNMWAQKESESRFGLPVGTSTCELPVVREGREDQFSVGVEVGKGVQVVEVVPSAFKVKSHVPWHEAAEAAEDATWAVDK